MNQLLFARFVEFVEQTEEKEQVFKDKKITMSLNYEKFNFQNMLKIVQLIKNAGGTYVKKSTETDVFVKEPESIFDEGGQLIECRRYNSVMYEKSKGKDVEVIEFEEFLSKLKITIDELCALPQIPVDHLKDDKYKK